MFYRVLLIISILLSGCSLQQADVAGYDEYVTGFLGVEGKPLMIVTGQKYSYVFEATEQFKSILTTSHSIDFKPTYSNFKLDQGNNVTGNISLVSEQAMHKEALTKLGFVENKLGHMQIDARVTGKRYQVEGVFPVDKLGVNQLVYVETPVTGIAKASKIVATPATIIIDSLAVISAVSLFKVLREGN